MRRWHSRALVRACQPSPGSTDASLASRCLKQVLVYFAVAKKGDAPTDGRTDANPEGLTAAYGRHARAFAARLHAAGLSCKARQLQAPRCHRAALGWHALAAAVPTVPRPCCPWLPTSRLPTPCRQVLDRPAFTRCMLEKLIWICAFMLVGARHGGCTVGEVQPWAGPVVAVPPPQHTPACHPGQRATAPGGRAEQTG